MQHDDASDNRGTGGGRVMRVSAKRCGLIAAIDPAWPPAHRDSTVGPVFAVGFEP
jgi:hypothetical protein